MLDYVERVQGLASAEALWRFHCDRMAAFGFDRLFYAFPSFPDGRPGEASGAYTVLTNHAPAYAARFVDDGLFRHAPEVRWAMRNTGATSWCIAQNDPASQTAQTRRALALNVVHKLTAGYTVGIGASGTRAPGLFALAARVGLDQDGADAVWTRHGREIAAMCYVAHLKLSTLPLATGRALTPRQREVLEWVGQGKTAGDIGLIMGLTQATVEKHLRLARQLFEADTTTEAVLKAAFRNQIYAAGP